MSDEREASGAVSAGRQIARAAGTVMAAYVAVQLVGLLRVVLVYRAFDASAALDSFNASNRVTELLFNLLAGGALSSAFIPTFTGLLTRDQREPAWKLASAVANLLLIVLSLVAGLAAIFAPQIVRHGLFVLAPGVNPGQEALTVALLRIQLPTVVIFGLSGLVMGILNANQRFWIPAITPAMYSLGQIGGVLLLPESWGVYRLAWGALGGSLLHLLIQLPSLLRLKGRYIAGLGLRMREVREVILLMGPRVLSAAVVQVNFIVNTIIALSLSEGSASMLTLAFTWMLMPLAAIAQSVAVAAMPTFSRQAALGRLDELRSTLASSLRGVLLLALPAAVGLVLLREPLFRWIYESERITQMAAWALLWYALGLPFHSLLEVVVRAFYALKDTRTPVMVGAAAMLLNIGASFALSAWFARLGWLPVGGLALANSLATLLEVSTLMLILRRRLNGLGGGAVGGAVLQAGLGSLGMAAAVWGWLALAGGLPGWALVPGAAAVGALAYAACALLLRVPEGQTVVRYARRLLRR